MMLTAGLSNRISIGVMKTKDPNLWPLFVAKFPLFVESFCSYNNIANYVLQTLQSDSQPNIMLYSAVGFPLNLLWNYVATKRWGQFSKKECLFEKNIVYYETPYFLEIDFQHPSNSRDFDNVQALIKTIVTATPIHTDRHVLVCRNIENITDPYALRVLLERFSKNALFICQTHSVCNMDPPLRSRFSEVRVPLFSVDEINYILQELGGQPLAADQHCRNIFKALLLSSGRDVATFDFPSNPTILELRDLSNRVCSNNIPFSILVIELLNRVPDKRKHTFVNKAAEIEHRMICTNMGRKPLYYELLFHVAFYGKN